MTPPASCRGTSPSQSEVSGRWDTLSAGGGRAAHLPSSSAAQHPRAQRTSISSASPPSSQTPDVVTLSQGWPTEVRTPSPGLVLQPRSSFDGPGAWRGPSGAENLTPFFCVVSTPRGCLGTGGQESTPGSIPGCARTRTPGRIQPRPGESARGGPRPRSARTPKAPSPPSLLLPAVEGGNTP